MSDIAIRVENLGKMYRIGGKQEQYHTFRDVITNLAVSPFRKMKSLLAGQAYGASDLNTEMWALKNVSFEIKQGEVVGIIGRNGAGKSTLLKVLSRITEPTRGYADIYGRVGALLEVGTGFHPELTGRENIYLNGTILGMSRKEIDFKFDEIVDFSGVELFIDTPVKHYSSGMGLRLGFAVAAHLEPEILIVDEVLAVGDAEFQKKCLGKMSDVASQGRTVLFVSHNMTSIASLTQRCLNMHEGNIVGDGDTARVIDNYLSSGSKKYSQITWEAPRPGDESLEFVSCQIEDGQSSEFSSDRSINISLEYRLKSAFRGLRVGFDLLSSEGILIFRSYQDDMATEIMLSEAGLYRAICTIPANLLNQGQYYITLRANIHAVRHICILESVLSFSIVNLTGVNSQYGNLRPGVISPALAWELLDLSLEGDR